MPSPRGRSLPRAASRTAEVWSPSWHLARRPPCWARGFWPAPNRAPTRTTSRWCWRRARRTPFGRSSSVTAGRMLRTEPCGRHSYSNGSARRRGVKNPARTQPVVGRTVIGGQPMPVLRFMGFPPNSDATGDIDSMDLLAGQSVGLIHEVKTAGQIVGELVAEARHIISERLAGLIVTKAAGG